MNQYGNNVMKNVTIQRLRLLKTIQANRAKHVADYDEAIGVYRYLLVERLKENSRILRRNIIASKEALAAETIAKLEDLEPIPKMPVNYLDAYDKAIAMLEFSCEEEIVLESVVFNQLVLDEWSWKSHFDDTIMLYKTAAVGMAR